MPILYNFMFHVLDNQYKRGLVDSNVIDGHTIHSNSTLLPFIDVALEPKVIREKVYDTLNKMKFSKEDVILVSGTPDLGVYLYTYFLTLGTHGKVDAVPRVYVPIRKKNNTNIRFREVLIEFNN